MFERFTRHLPRWVDRLVPTTEKELAETLQSSFRISANSRNRSNFEGIGSDISKLGLHLGRKNCLPYEFMRAEEFAEDSKRCPGYIRTEKGPVECVRRNHLN